MIKNDHDILIQHDEKIKTLDDKVDLILTNHLPHIQDKLEKVENKIAVVENKIALWSGAIIILGILLPLALRKLFGI